MNGKQKNAAHKMKQSVIDPSQNESSKRTQCFLFDQLTFSISTNQPTNISLVLF